MRRNKSSTTYRHTNTGYAGGVPRPDRSPQRTTGGMVAFVVVPVAVVAAVVAPVATAVVAMVGVGFAVATTAVLQTRGQKEPSGQNPGDASPTPHTPPAD